MSEVGGSQVGVTHQIAVYLGGTVAALSQAPDDEALAPAHIAADEDFVHVGAEALVGHIAPGIPLHAERLSDVVLTAHETGGDESQLAVVGELFAGGHHAGAAGVGVALGLQIGDDRAGQISGLVLQELLHGGLVNAGVLAELGNALGLAVVHLQHPGPLGPRIVRRTLLRGLGHHLQRHQVGAALPQGRALTVVAGVAAADDEDILTCGADGLAVGKAAVQQALGHAGEVVHREMDALGIPAGDVQVPGLLCAAAEDDGVVALEQFGGIHGPAHIHVGAELHAFGLHDLDAALDDGFVQLHVGNSVHQQAAHTVGTLEHSHRVAALVQVLGHRQARGAAADDGHALAGAGRGRGGVEPALGVARLYDGVLVLPDGDAAAGHIAAGAGGFAEGRVDPARELRETIGSPQTAERQLPLALIHEVVPLRDEVVQGAAGGHAADHHACLTEGDAAVHAACRLRLLLLPGEPDVKFVEILDALQRRNIRAGLARVIHKTSEFCHDVPLLTSSSARRRMLRSAPARRRDPAPPWRR